MRRLLSLLLLCAVAALAGSPLDFTTYGVVYDNFERHTSIAGTPDILSPQWTTGMGGGFGIFNAMPAGQSYCFSGFPCTAYWSTTAGLSDDQVARATPKGSGTQPRGGVGVRISANNGYFVRLTTNNAALIKYVGGVATTLASSAITTTGNQYAEVTAHGTTIRAKVWAAWANPLVLVWDSGDITDSSLSTGSVGMLSTQYPGGIDDFLAGNYSTLASLPLPPAAHSSRIDVYADPQASVLGDGSFANPLILDMLASHGSWVGPGDTVWLRGSKAWPVPSNRWYTPSIEIYNPDNIYLFAFLGTTGAHVSVRGYPGEYVVIDPNRSCLVNIGAVSPYIVNLSSSTYTDLMDVWVRNSDTSCRILPQCGSNPNPNGIRGVQLVGDGNSIINVTIYNTAEGIGSIVTKNNRIYGSISVMSGWNAPDRGHGHPHYAGNTDCTVQRRTVGNIFGTHGGSGGKFIQSGTNPGICNHYYAENIGFRQLQRPIGLDMSGVASGDVSFVNNSFFNNPQSNQVGLGTTFTATGNWFDGPQQYFLKPTGGTFTGNTVSDSTSSGANGIISQICTGCSAAQTWTSFDNNAYFQMGTSNAVSRPFCWNASSSGACTGVDFAGWQALGFDAHSTMNTTSYPAKSTTPPGTTNFVHYHANPLNGSIYAGYGNIAVYNWRRLTSVVTSPTFLVSGSEYEIWDPFQFSTGPMLTGVYNGTSLTVPMDQSTLDDPGFARTWSTPYWCPAGTDTSSTNFTATGLVTGTAPYGIVVSGTTATVTTGVIHNIAAAGPFPIRLEGTAGGLDGDYLVTQTGSTTYTFTTAVAPGNYQQPSSAISRKGFTSQTAGGSQAITRPQPDFGPYAVRRRNVGLPRKVTLTNGIASATSVNLLSGQNSGDTSMPVMNAACTTGNTCTWSADFLVGKLYFQLQYLSAGGSVLETSSPLLVDMPTSFGGTVTPSFALTGGGTAAATFAAGVGLAAGPTGLHTGTIGAAYTETLIASGGTGPYTFAKPTGSLPPGLALNTSTGVISGTPTTAGLYSFTVQATDSLTVASAAVPLTTQINAALSITTTLPGSLVGLPYTQTMAATGGVAPLVWDLSAGSLPSGLSMDAAGSITGSTTVAGNFVFTVRATDANGATATQAYTVAIGGSLQVATTSLPAGLRNVFYSGLVRAVNGTAPYTWAVTVGSLPAGVTLAPSTGLITGTNNVPGVYSFTVRVTDNVGVQASQALTLQIQQPQGLIGSGKGSFK